jgi:hypothetical protein
MMIVALWLLFAVVVAALSRSRGHSFALSLVIAALLSPLVALIVELCRAAAGKADQPARAIPKASTPANVSQQPSAEDLLGM